MKMKLSDREWREFKFTDIFVIKSGFYNKKPNIELKGNIPFLGATANNNGITEFYSIDNIKKSSKTGDINNESLEKKIFNGNCICVTNNGSVGYAYYQKTKFTCSHDVNPLYLKNYFLTKNIAMFLISMIEQQRVCFQYARKWRPKRMKSSRLMLPVDKDNNPDWDFMENYIEEQYSYKQKKYKVYLKKRIKEIGKAVKVPSLANKEWHEFFVVDLFSSVQRGKRLTKKNQTEGNVPYVSSTALNNGVDNYIGNRDKVRIFNDCLSIANSGSVGATFYHPYEFVASDHVTHLKNKDMTMYVYMFIATMASRMSSKYNFNREINDKRISREKIILPVNDNNEPDYEYMEQYMKNLMLKKYKQFQTFKETN